MSREDSGCDDSLYPIAVLIDELRNEDVQVKGRPLMTSHQKIMTTLWQQSREKYKGNKKITH
jgi:hypothetical protein